MAGDKILHSDLVQPGDPLSPMQAYLERTKKQVIGVRGELKLMKKEMVIDGKGGKALKGYETQLGKVTKKVTESNELKRQEIKLQNDIVKTQAQIKAGYKNTAYDLKKLQDIRKKNNKAIADQIKRENDLRIINNKNVKSLNDMKARTSALIRERDRLNITTKKGKAQFDKLTQSINRQNKALLKHDKAIGRSQRNVGNYAGAFSTLAGAMGVSLGAYGIFRVLSGGARIAIEFEEQMAKVKAITGATAEEFKLLEGNAKSLGGATLFTAKQVGELQLEYAKLGFTTREILAATKSTLDLATATGESLAEAAIVAGATLRGFTMDASQMQRVVDVMAKGFTTSALDLENFKEAMKLIAPIANSAGVSLEYTTNLLGKLADAGLRGSIGATGFKNVLLEMTNPASKLAKTLGFTVRNSEDLQKALTILSEKHLDLTEAQQLINKRGAAALLILSQNKDIADSLADSYEDVNGSAREMAEVIEGTVAAQVTLLKSAWDGWMLSIEEGTGLMGNFWREVITSTREFIELITPINRELKLYEEASEDAAKSTGKMIKYWDELGKIESKEQLGQLTDSVSEQVEALNTSVNLIGQLEDKYGKFTDKVTFESEGFLTWAKEHYPELSWHTQGWIKDEFQAWQDRLALTKATNKQEIAILLNYIEQKAELYEKDSIATGKKTKQAIEDSKNAAQANMFNVEALNSLGKAYKDLPKEMQDLVKIQSKVAEAQVRVRQEFERGFISPTAIANLEEAKKAQTDYLESEGFIIYDYAQKVKDLAVAQKAYFDIVKKGLEGEEENAGIVQHYIDAKAAVDGYYESAVRLTQVPETIGERNEFGDTGSAVGESPEDEDSSSYFEGIFGISEDDYQAYIDSAQALSDGITDILSHGIQERMDLADNEHQYRSDQVSDFESMLNEQLLLQEEGNANEVDAIKTRLEAERKLRDEALKTKEEERVKLEKINKAQRISNNLMTISNLIVSASKITEGFSSIPIAGVPLAIAALATLFAMFQDFTTKVETIKYHTGTERVGPGTGEKTVTVTEDERIFSGEHNREIGNLSNDEVVDIVKYYKGSLKGMDNILLHEAKFDMEELKVESEKTNEKLDALTRLVGRIENTDTQPDGTVIKRRLDLSGIKTNV